MSFYYAYYISTAEFYFKCQVQASYVIIPSLLLVYIKIVAYCVMNQYMGLFSYAIALVLVADLMVSFCRV